MTVQKQLLVSILRYLPQGLISRAWGRLARVRRPKFFVRWLKQTFINAVGINMEEAALPLEKYDCLEAVFVRYLRPKARPVDPAAHVITSPVDGTIGARGLVRQGLLFQVKGRTYSLDELLGTTDQAQHFEGGHFLTIYLSPKDYHRIHAPYPGRVEKVTVLPGGLMPVFAESVAKVDKLFARNERIISYLESPAGTLVVAKIGATLVGRITLAFDARIASNQGHKKRQDLTYTPGILFDKGQEMASFELGSTVVLVSNTPHLSFDALPEGTPIRLGQRIGIQQTSPHSQPG